MLTVAFFFCHLSAVGIVDLCPTLTRWPGVFTKGGLTILLLGPMLYFLMLHPLARLLRKEALARRQELHARQAASRTNIELERTNVELNRLNRLFYLLSQVNQAAAHATDELSLFSDTCRVFALGGDYLRGWIGLIEGGDRKTLRPVARFGDGGGSLEPIGLESEPTLSTRPILEAALTNRPCLEQAAGESNKENSRAEDGESVWAAALPLCGQDGIYGVLTVYFVRRGGIGPAEVELFKELASGLGLSVEALRSRTKQLRMHEQIESLGQLKEGLLGSSDLGTKLKRISDGVVDVFGADFARIWTIGKGDLCGEGCIHASARQDQSICRNRERCLHLQASSGRYTHVDGDHRRIPLGCFKIGALATGSNSQLVSNDVQEDPRIHDREWAKRLELTSFAGYRLVSPQGEAVGVLAMFGQRPLAAYEQRLLEDLGNTTSQVIVAGITSEALQESEGKLRTILEGCPIPQFVIDRNHNLISWNRPLEAITGVKATAVLGTKSQQRIFRETSKATLADLLMDGAHDEIRMTYGEPDDPVAWEKGIYHVVRHFPDVLSEGKWLRLTAAIIYDARKAVIGAVETLEDIDEQKRTEEALRRSRSELEERVRTRTRELDLSNRVLQSEVEQRKQAEEALLKAHLEAETLLASLSSFLIGTDSHSKVVRWNAAAESTFGIPARAVLGKRLEEVEIGWDRESILAAIGTAMQIPATVSLQEVPHTSPEGKERILSLTVNGLFDAQRRTEGVILLGMDVTERRNLQLQLVQAQKLESIGQLAAGIAHEINTPTQYVGDNLEFLEEAFNRLGQLLPKYGELLEAAEAAGVNSGLPAQLHSLTTEIRLDYLLTQIPRAISQSLEGTSRVANIVQAMKEFSHPDAPEKTAVDINRAIQSTVTVARNEWKYVAEVLLDLDASLPPVPCLPGEFNQVVLNILINAAHAVADVVGRDGQNPKGQILVSTRQDGNWAELQIRDTGAGIPEEIRHRVFDPFFTTKAVGKGTGQGLAIAHNVIVDKHGGAIDFESEIGKGTTFIIRLPIRECEEA
jgi:PAS domain S-box-containing protein